MKTICRRFPLDAWDDDSASVTPDQLKVLRRRRRPADAAPVAARAHQPRLHPDRLCREWRRRASPPPAAETPAIIISDYHMPEMHGLQLVEALRANDALDQTVIIMLSAADDQARDRERARLRCRHLPGQAVPDATTSSSSSRRSTTASTARGSPGRTDPRLTLLGASAPASASRACPSSARRRRTSRCWWFPSVHAEAVPALLVEVELDRPLRRPPAVDQPEAAIAEQRIVGGERDEHRRRVRRHRHRRERAVDDRR